jgi:PIN domain nuclease of toxin-antitoxin system
VRLLLDSHAFLWFILGDTRLSDRARSAIAAAQALAESIGVVSVDAMFDAYGVSRVW